MTPASTAFPADSKDSPLTLDQLIRKTQNRRDSSFQGAQRPFNAQTKRVFDL